MQAGLIFYNSMCTGSTVEANFAMMLNISLVPLSGSLRVLVFAAH